MNLRGERTMKNKDIKLLFLAKYAPESINSPIPSGIHDTVYAQYHHDIYKILYEEFETIVSMSDINEYVNNRPSVDFVFSLYNRMPFRNSEIFVSSLSEYYKIPYLGATPNVRAIAEDKHFAKLTALYAGIPTAKWSVCNVGDNFPVVSFDGPYFVKPRFGATSIGINNMSFCLDIDSMLERIKYFHSQNLDVIIEQYIEGTSVTVPILNNFNNTLVLPYVIEQSTLEHNIITYEQKRKIKTGLSRVVNTDSNMQHIINKYSIKFWEYIQPLDYTRIDFIIDKNNIPHFIEFNICCNLGKHAAINLAANAKNISYEALINNITYSSLYRQNLIDTFCGKEL